MKDSDSSGPKSPGDGLVDLPLRSASTASSDLEFDPLGDGPSGAGSSNQDTAPSAEDRRIYHGRPRRRGGLLLLLSLIAMVALVWFFFPEAPRVGLSRSELSFGTVLVGQSGVEESIAVTNLGERKLVIRGLEFENAVADDYNIVQTDCLDRKIESGAGCEVRLVFAPRTPGDRSTRLLFAGNDSTDPALVVQAQAVAPELGFAPATVSFGVVALEAEPVSRKVTLSNVGTATLEFRRIRLAGDAAADFDRASRCPKTKLEPGEACSFDVLFEPSVSGPRTVELIVDSNALGSPASLAIEGVGLWEGPPLDPSVERLSFGEQKVGKRGARKVLEFVNRTGGPVSVDRTTVSESTSFAVVEDGCRDRLVESGESCAVALTFVALRDGVEKGVLSLSAAGASESVEVRLEGVGVTPRLEVGSRTVDFEQQRLGFESAPRRVVLRNTGSATLTLRSVAVGGADAAEFLPGSDDCVGKKVPPGKSCSVAVGFNPTKTGTRRAVLTIDPGFELEPIQLEMSGVGVASSLAANPGRLDFGQVFLGRVETRRLTLSNSGSARLTLRGLRFDGDDAGVFGLGKVGCPLDSGLAPGAECAVELTFDPAEARGHRAGLVLDYNGPDSPARVELSAEAREPAPAFEISTISLDLGTAEVGDRGEIGTVVISNPGAAWLTLTSVTLTGESADSFQLVAGSCDGVSAIAPGGSCTVGVRFAPVAEGAMRAAILVRHGAQGGSATVALAGRSLPSLGQD